jgi:hypothetical protein
LTERITYDTISTHVTGGDIMGFNNIPAPQAPDKSPVQTNPGGGPSKKRTAGNVPTKIPNNPETGGGGREGDGH